MINQCNRKYFCQTNVCFFSWFFFKSTFLKLPELGPSKVQRAPATTSLYVWTVFLDYKDKELGRQKSTAHERYPYSALEPSRKIEVRTSGNFFLRFIFFIHFKFLPVCVLFAYFQTLRNSLKTYYVILWTFQHYTNNEEK